MIQFWEFLAEIGFAISLLANAIFFIPQAIKLYRNKDSQGVSSITFLGFNVIQIFTGLHAFIVHDWILFWGSALAFVTCGSVTMLTFFYRKNNDR